MKKDYGVMLPNKGDSPWEYASFFWRMGAGCIDTLILIVLNAVLIGLVFKILALLDGNSSSGAGIAGFIVFALLLVSIFVICGLYFAFFESSSWRASIGKRLCRRIVVNSDGTGLSLRDSVCRFLVNICRPPLWVDDGLMIFTDKRQDLEDMVSETYVLRRKAE